MTRYHDNGITMAMIPRGSWPQADELFKLWSKAVARAEDTPYYPTEGAAQAQAWRVADHAWKVYQDFLRDEFEASLDEGMRDWIDQLRDQEDYRRGA